RVEDIDDVRTQSVDCCLDKFLLMRQQRQSGVDRSLFTKVGGVEQRGDHLAESRFFLPCQSEEQDDPGETELVPPLHRESCYLRFECLRLLVRHFDGTAFVEVTRNPAE